MERDGRRPVRTVAASVVAIVLSVVPAFLVGAVAVLIRDDMTFTESQLGLCIGAFYGLSAVFSVHGGLLAERMGGLRATSAGVVGSTVALVGIALLARQWWHIAAFLALAGTANALTQPATNLALARAVPVARQGVAFGVKQTDGSLATLVGGVAAAAIAVPFGWRWSVAAVAAGAAVFPLVRPPGWRADPPPQHAGDGAGDAALAGLVLLSAGSGIATGSGAALAGFYVDSVTAAGLGVAAAGWWLVAGSVCGTAARIGWGQLVDRGPIGPFHLVAALLAAGGAGFWLLGVPGTVALAAGTVLAFAAGWAWHGVLLYGIVRASPGAPARSTGILMAGTACGGVLGPVVFGWLAQDTGYPGAWRAAAAALAVSAAAMLVAGETLRRRSRGAAVPH